MSPRAKRLSRMSDCGPSWRSLTTSAVRGLRGCSSRGMTMTVVATGEAMATFVPGLVLVVVAEIGLAVVVEAGLTAATETGAGASAGTSTRRSPFAGAGVAAMGVPGITAERAAGLGVGPGAGAGLGAAAAAAATAGGGGSGAGEGAGVAAGTDAISGAIARASPVGAPERGSEGAL